MRLHTKKTVLPIIFLITTTIILISIFSLCVIDKNNNKDLNINGTVYPQAKNILPFNLKIGKNQTLSDDDLKNHWSIVFFGYANCPDVCPSTLNILNDFYQQILAQHLPRKLKPKIIFVTLDPKRDEAENLDKYAKFFNKNFIAAAGNTATTDQLIRDFGVVAIKNKPNSDGEYFIDHSSHMFLINPQAQIQAIFTAPHKSEMLAKDYTNIVENINYG